MQADGTSEIDCCRCAAQRKEHDMKHFSKSTTSAGLCPDLLTYPS